jgi:hypothetical protein
MMVDTSNGDADMRSAKIFSLVLIMLFVLSFASLSRDGPATNSSLNGVSTSDQSLVSENPGYFGTGSPLTVAFSGTFANNSPWTQTTQTLSSEFAPGTSFLVTNSSFVQWTAYILVSPPAEIKTVSFTVTYHGTEWKPTALTNPVGVVMSYPSQWWYDADKIYVSSTAAATYGVWKLEFLGVNQISNLQLGKSGGSLSSTATFDTATLDEMLFRTTSTWIGGSTTEYVLTDPTGSQWYSSTNTTAADDPNHILQSFAYRKDITIDRSRHLSTSITNFPVLIDLYDSDLHTKVQPNGDDIVFYSSGHIVPHEIELFNQNYSPTQAHLIAWVKVNLTGSVNTVISMYYGNPLIGSQQRPELVWTENFAAVWHLKETATAGGTTTIHYDSTANSYDGQQNGNANDVGKIGTGQRFDGSNDQIVISSSKGLNPTGDIQISAWFKLDNPFNSATQYTQPIIVKYLDGNNNLNLALAGTDYTFLSSPGSLVFKIENGGAQMYKYTTTQRSWLAGVWYHVTCFIDSDTPSNNMIYVNGSAPTIGTTGSLTSASVSFSADWGIGGGSIDQGGQATAWFDGVIDEVTVSTIIRAAAWRSGSYSNQLNPSNFYSVGTQQQRVSPELTMKKIADSSAKAGVWKISTFYNDSGSSVNYRAGMYERSFTVRRASSLAVTAPTAAIGNGVVSLIVGDILYTEVDLTDSLTGGISGATVVMNWTVGGSSSPVNLNDMGGGVYGVAVNTSDLELNMRWRINLVATASYHTQSSTYFYLDLYHETRLDYSDVSTTPVGMDSNATLAFYDTYDGSRIQGATIKFANGNPVTVLSQSNGIYHISVDTSPLAQGTYSYIINATKPGSFYTMATANLTFTIRPHYATLSVSGNLVTPIGNSTSLTIRIIDVDTGVDLSASDVSSFLLNPASYSDHAESSPTDLFVNLDTSTWAVGTETVTLSVMMSSSNYYTPNPYDFQISIRKHYTAIGVIGNLVMPYGNTTPVTIVITDIDTGATLPASVVQSFTFASLGTTESNPTDLFVNLPTGSLLVGMHAETLQLTMKASSNYYSPSDYGFSITIRSLTTVLHNVPNDLIFPNGDDLVVQLQFNVSEHGPFYGDPINGVLAAAFYVTNATYVYPKSIVGLGNGVYQLTISAAYFASGPYTIFITVSPASSTYARADMVLNFEYRAARSDLTANLYTVSTPYHHNVTVTLSYIDLDRATGIVTGTIISPDATIYPVNSGGGSYAVTIGVFTLNVGTHQVNLTAMAPGYTTKSVFITVIVTKIHTNAQPSVISLDMPVGNTKVFYIDFTDLDNSIPIGNSTYNPTDDWSGAVSLSYVWTGTRYEVTITTTGSDPLGLYTITFLFSPGSNYFDASCQIEVDVRTHITIFNLVSAVEPTPFNGIVNISLRYYDWDNKVGIDSTNIDMRVWNQTDWITNTPINLGLGYYTLQIDATLFGQGVQYFDIYFNWTGPVQQYENKSTTASVNIIGVDSQLALLVSSEPTYYLGTMGYTFFYSEVNGPGITNSSYGGGHVHISVSFEGVSVDLSKVTITEIDPVLQPGKYSISFNTTIFGKTGLIYMNVYINWSAGVAPYYTNRADVISVRVLARDTTLAVVPPSPTAYGENATFTFSFDDVTGGSNIPIDNNTALSVLLSLGDYSITYNPVSHYFTVSFNTNQFGAPLGQKSFTLGVTWAGSPFYANRTGRIISVTVTARQTTLDFQSPAPTSYLDNVTLSIDWNDVTSVPATGISSATVQLYDVTGATYIPSIYYTIYWISGGQYEIAFNTTYYSVPNTYSLRVNLSTLEFYIPDASSTRLFNVRYRLTLLSAEPIGLVPYNSSLVFTLDFQDLDTLETIPSPSGQVTLAVLNSSWTYNAVWNPAFQTYTLTIQTYNHPELVVGIPYTLRIQASYAYQSPFYASDDVYISFTLRTRQSRLVVDASPDPTAYLENAQFRVYYFDVDSSTGITANSVIIRKGVTVLTPGVNYTLTYQGNGYYLISVSTTALDGLGYTILNVEATWNPAISPFHDNANVDVSIYVTKREANVEITAPPSQTRFLDNVEFSFVYRDLRSGSGIGTITSANVAIWSGGILLTSGQYNIIQIGSTFTVTINSTTISSSLVTNFNVTVHVDWNDATAPYYFDDSSIVRVTTTNRRMSYAVLPAEEAAYGELLNLSFSITDADSGNPVQLVPGNIDFDGKTVSLTEGVDFWIDFTQSSIGIYTIRIDTVAVGLPSTYKFNLHVNWNLGTQPYYLSLTPVNPIEMSGVISQIDTILYHMGPDPETAIWGNPAIGITVNYTNLVFGNLTTGATVTWAWPEAEVEFGPAGEPLGDGIYVANVDPSLANETGTFILTFKATGLAAYKTAYLYVTFIVVAAGSDMVPIDPIIPVVQINRGAALDITIRLDDGTHNPIDNSYKIDVIATIDGFNYHLEYNGTIGYYTVQLPANNESATKKQPGFYTISILASLRNYEPAAYSFKIQILLTETSIRLTGGTSAEMIRTYTESVPIYAQLIIPIDNNASFWHANITWSVYGTTTSGDFVHISDGNYTAILDTMVIGYGIWTIIFKATPWANESLYSTSQRIITFTVQKIRTSSTPPLVHDYYWGQAVNLTFKYWDETFDRGIANASVDVEFPGWNGEVTYTGNGEYQILFDTSLFIASPNYIPLTITFQKINYLSSSSIINIRVLEVPTELIVATPEINVDPDHSGQYRVPIGDILNITVFYNDTDFSDNYVGGLSGANLTLNEVFGPTRTLTEFQVVELGGGYYSFLFDTLDSWLFESSIGGPTVQANPYTLTFRLSIGNYSVASQVIKVFIIQIPTSFEIVSTVGTLQYGESGALTVKYIDNWPGHPNGTLISGANFTFDYTLTQTNLLILGTPYEDQSRHGYYLIEFTAASPLIGDNTVLSQVSLVLSLPNAEEQVVSFSIRVEPTQLAIYLTQIVSLGAPAIILIVLLGGLYVRVWSVPKRIRQINRQIKSIRKGKVPKPVPDAKSRQELIVALFNDTNKDVGIVRTPDQMPEESVPVQVPELGELLIQLAILTNLNAQELDDFKADITKMKMSEQAAFVKEVIMQEAIRAARRENKTVEQIIEETRNQASKRVAGAAEEAMAAEEAEEEEPEVERVILPSARPPVAPKLGIDLEEPEPVEEERIEIQDDRLSPFEIDELKKDLQAKGVPLHEIDTILKQVRELPRDLVEELLKSLDKERK